MKDELNKKSKLAKLKEIARQVSTRGIRGAEDANQEQRDAKKYKDVGPIISKGIFSTISKNQPTGLTQAELDKKRKK